MKHRQTIPPGICGQSASEPVERSNASGDCKIGLGIDAGGTFTDAVIYDIERRELLAKAKAPTTYHDLVCGIRSALDQLPAHLLRRVRVTALSTTLATNSIVEGKSHKVGVIALSPWGWTVDQLQHAPLINVPGSVSINGDILHPLDETACREAVRVLVEVEQCAAIAVAGYATVRNPEQANRVREIILEMSDVPVVCSHEMSRRINGIAGAQTAIANAGLLPVIRALIDSARRALADYHVFGKLMVVKGDGTPIDEQVARERPVETILSGPAASVSGARILTGLSDALVLDMGGTTTDCAVVRDGSVAVSKDGARVGQWLMSVDAVEVSTTGLGGDSRLDFTHDRRITVGPARAIPFCNLASECNYVKEWLINLCSEPLVRERDASALDVLVFGEHSANYAGEREKALLDLLQKGPVSALQAAEMLGVPSHTLLPISHLQKKGAIKLCSLTPTDLLHISGSFVKWDAEASHLALKAFAAMYGDSAENMLESAMQAFRRRLFDEIVRREVSAESRTLQDLPQDWEFVLGKGFEDNGRGLHISLSLRQPIIAVGAPAQALVKPVADHIRTEVIIPPHADVANAIGAIGSEVVVREEVLVKAGYAGTYTLHGTGERTEYSELAEATHRGREISRERAFRRALEAGASTPEVTVTCQDFNGSAADGVGVFLERRIIAVAVGSAFSVSEDVLCR